MENVVLNSTADTNFIMSTKGQDYESLNVNVKKTRYAIRGELYLRALELQMQGKKVWETY